MKTERKTTSQLCRAICILAIAVSAGCGGGRDKGASVAAPAVEVAAAVQEEQAASMPELKAGEPDAPGLGAAAREAYTAIAGVPPLGAAGGPSYSAYYKTSNAFDANPATWWVGQAGAGSWDLYYGLSSTVTLTQLNVNFYGTAFTPGTVRLYTSTDGTNWTLSGEISNTSSKPAFTQQSVSAKYIRIQMVGAPPAGIPIIREVDVYPAVFKIGATAGPNYNDDWYFAANAFDGNPSTWWAGKANAGAWDVYYNFGAPRQIGQMTASFFSPSCRPATATLFVSSDGINYTKIGNLSPDAVSTIFASTSTQYIKLSMTGNPASTVPIIKDISFDTQTGAMSEDSYSSNFRPAAAFDNNPSTNWAGQKGLAAWKLYYIYSAATAVKNITIHYSDLGHTPGSTALMYSNDGVNWTLGGTFSSGADAKLWANVTAKHIMFKMTSTSNDPNFFPIIKDINIGGPMVANTRLAAGYSRSCALTNAGGVKCWGRRYPGDGSSNDSTTTPVSVTGITNALSVTAGDDHACALLNTGAVKCWGINHTGYGTFTVSLTPASVSGITNAVNIDAGGGHTCAVLSTGGVMCWGYGLFGEIGNGTDTYALAPAAVSGISNAVAVTSAWHHSCALLVTGAVKCWGNNGNGQLGNGITTNSNTPVTVSGLSNAVALSSSDGGTCAITSTGGVKCWGSNLGDGTSNTSSVPVTVPGLANVLSISSGGSHTCALNSYNTMQCWGGNPYGAIGSNSQYDSPAPNMNLLASPIEHAGGFNHACYMLPDNTIRCTGDNCDGDLGGGAAVGNMCGTHISPITVLNYP